MKIALSVGCPCGIGPEVAVAAADQLKSEDIDLVLLGDAGAIEEAARSRGIELSALHRVRVEPVSNLDSSDRTAGKPSAAAGRSQLDAIDRAVDMVVSGNAHAIVTGPVSKYAISASGAAFVGHTEHLQTQTNSARVVMMFAGPKLKTSLVSTHWAIADVPKQITLEAVTETVVMTAIALVRDYGIAHPKLVVTGLNPHAGENGMFGFEERDVIAPAITAARARLGAEVELYGPTAAEAAFRQARDGQFDCVVAMYHDQATIASKLLDFGDAVNVTLGLPIIRTSVDHGTGYDIAGRGIADASGMVAAIRMAREIASRRRT